MMKTLEDLIEVIKGKHKTLFILCGFPYSGKTHIAREIMKEVPMEYVSIDDIFHEGGYDWDINKLPDQKVWEEIFETSYEKVRQALNRGVNVLYDSTNHTKVSRNILRKVAQEQGADSQVIFIDVPEAVIHDRWEKNRLNPIRSVVAKDLVLSTLESFERPGEDEKTTALFLEE